MTNNTRADDHDPMRSSAHALSKKLHLAITDVFGNDVQNDENDYNNMLNTLRQRQIKKQTKYSAPKKSDGSRAIIAKKLLEGYALHGDVCDECETPLMSYLGQVTCVVCPKTMIEKEWKTKVTETTEAASDVELALTSTSQSTMSEEEEYAEVLVNKELSQLNERRSRAIDVYTSKILLGYVMQEQACSECSMPMMKNKDSIECVFCRKDVKQARIGPTNKDMAAKPEENANPTSRSPLAPIHRVKPRFGQHQHLSHAEAMAERLRSKGHENSTESQLEKAENELLITMEALATQGNQSGEVSKALQTYFLQKKQGRATEEWLNEAKNSLLEVEEVAAQESASSNEEDINQALRAIDKLIVTSVDDENEICASHGPPTPHFDSSIGCSIGSIGFPDFLKKMFASGPTENFPQRELRLSSNPNGMSTANRFVECGPFSSVQGNSHSAMKQNKDAQDDITMKMAMPRTSAEQRGGPGTMAQNMHAMQSNLNDKTQADITNKMANQLMAGWTVVEGSQCPSCYMPTMLDPQTRLIHCVACEVVLMKLGMSQTSIQQMANTKMAENLPKDDSENLLVRRDIGIAQTIENTASKSLMHRALRENINPGPIRSGPRPMHSMPIKLKVDTESQSTPANLPDPTVSMYEFKDQYKVKKDPAPSMNIPYCSEQTHLNTGAPTPATKGVRYKAKDPTPNVHAMRNKVCAATPPKPKRYMACDPAPDRFIRPTIVTEDGPITQTKMDNRPTPAMQTLWFRRGNPTPNVRAVRKRINQLEPCHSEDTLNASGYSRRTRSIDP